MTIKEVSEKYNLPTSTLRYYEQEHLIPSVKRLQNGNREYSEADCSWIEFIKCMKEAGMSIEILREYTTLYQQGEKTRTKRLELLKQERVKIAQKIKTMQQHLEKLDYKIDNYNTAFKEAENSLK